MPSASSTSKQTGQTEQGFWEHCYRQSFPERYSLEQVFAFFSEAANLESITPPYLKFKILTPQPILMQANAQIQYRITLSGIPMHWHTRIADWQPPHRFVDCQTSGPYRLWWHEHSFVASPAGVLMQDLLRYDPGYGVLGPLIYKFYLRRAVDRIFAYRRQRLTELFPA